MKKYGIKFRNAEKFEYPIYHLLIKIKYIYLNSYTKKSHPKLIALMNMVSNIINVKEFYLFGGNVIDFYFADKLNYGDIDIIIPEMNEDDISAILNRLELSGFIISRRRVYYICIDIKIYLYQAKKSDVFIDIVFSDQPRLVMGPLNALSMYCKYPDLNVVDEFQCIKALTDKRFKCLEMRNFNNENPYIIISRFIALCAKYDVSLLKSRNHRSLIDKFNEVKIKWVNISEFHNDVYLSFVAKLLKSIIKSNNRVVFINELLQSKILNIIFEELNNALFQSIQVKYYQVAFNSVKSTEELTMILVNNYIGNNRTKLKKIMKQVLDRP